MDTESWIEDKLYRAKSDDFGHSEDSAEILLRSHETLQLDVHGFESKIEELSRLSRDMIQNGHFEHALITERQVLYLVSCILNVAFSKSSFLHT